MLFYYLLLTRQKHWHSLSQAPSVARGEGLCLPTRSPVLFCTIIHSYTLPLLQTTLLSSVLFITIIHSYTLPLLQTTLLSSVLFITIIHSYTLPLLQTTLLSSVLFITIIHSYTLPLLINNTDSQYNYC